MLRSLPRVFVLRLLALMALAIPVAGAAPNILFAIADDQSYPYTSAYGSKTVQTPAFDRLAADGVLFHNAFAPAPQCSPCRAAILTGRNIWEIEEAGTHSSYFPKKFPVFTRELESIGYHVGYTGKPWSPGNFADAGWTRNPVGTAYNEATLKPPTSGIKTNDYAGNFQNFLEKRRDDQPFFFWFGASEPHRAYAFGSGAKAGKDLADAEVPGFLPDTETVRHDVLDYAREVEWFDQHLGRMLKMLEEAGELENTIVVVTADNGMPFPSAKANLQEYGTHVPLVISGPEFFKGGREVQDLASLIDLTPTFLELAGANRMRGLTGRSLLPLLKHGREHRDHVLTGRERHSHSHPDNHGYPARAIRTDDFLYVWNVKPDRWPAGMPAPAGLTAEQMSGSISSDFKSIDDGYADIDGSPSKTVILENPTAHAEQFALAVGKRPSEQLYDVRRDPDGVNDLAGDPKFAAVRDELRQRLLAELRGQNDPRVSGSGNVIESYPRFGGMRYYPGFKMRGEYNLAALDDADEWTVLFDGSSLAQWTNLEGDPVKDGWRIEAGTIHRFAEGGDIISRGTYENFILEFEWKISEVGNSGVKYRARGKLGLEYQILDDAKHADGKKTSRRASSLYDLSAAPDNKPVSAIGEWNSARIVAKGRFLEHWLNGVKVMSIEQNTDDWNEHFAASKYAKREGFGFGAGHILLQDHKDPVWFRNIRIKRLP
ncbi:sulfatase-like hydrolase/transferase [Opitutaceae bacterium]|nr:sulfatase-like hydrolase/transferase [Opitutaceae bacterium]